MSPAKSTRLTYVLCCHCEPRRTSCLSEYPKIEESGVPLVPVALNAITATPLPAGAKSRIFSL